MVKEVYPDWILRVYFDRTIRKEVKCEIECLKDESGSYLDNVDFCNVESLPKKGSLNETFSGLYMHAMMWRWLPIGDSFVDAFQSRDTDSLIQQREVDATKAWVASDKPGHIMRDHPFHATEILGGMWSFHSSRDRFLANKIFATFINLEITKAYNADLKNPKGNDQFFLRDHVYYTIKEKSLIHDSYFCNYYGGGGVPYPTRRNGDCFISKGDECDSNGKFQDCPVECRPKEHKDWNTC